MEKKQKHKWSKDGRRNLTSCELCGCEKTRGVYSVRYTTLDGKISQVVPECNEKVFKNLN